MGRLFGFYTVLAKHLVEAAAEVFIFKISIGHWKVIGFKCDRNIICLPYPNSFDNVIPRGEAQRFTVNSISGFLLNTDNAGPRSFSVFSAGIMKTVNAFHIAVYGRYGYKSSFALLPFQHSFRGQFSQSTPDSDTADLVNVFKLMFRRNTGTYRIVPLFNIIGNPLLQLMIERTGTDTQELAQCDSSFCCIIMFQYNIMILPL